MAADNRSSSSNPFGYTFPTYPTTNNPPAGPPLLDQDESSTLQNFFNDPDHFGTADDLADPSLTSLGAGVDSRNSLFNGDNSWMYAQDQPFPNPFPEQDHSFTSTHAQQFLQQQRHAHTPVAGGPEDVLTLVGIPTNNTPQDVLHAASTLFMYRANQIPDQNSVPNLSQFFTTPGRSESRQPQNTRHSSYPFNMAANPSTQHQQQQHYTPPVNGHFRASFDASNTHSHPTPTNHSQAHPPMYHFGSDNNFRHNGYAPPFDNLEDTTTQPHIDFVRGMVSHTNGGASSVDNSVPPTPDVTRVEHKFYPASMHTTATESVEQRPPPEPEHPKPKKRRKARPSGGNSEDNEVDRKPVPNSPAYNQASSPDEIAVTEVSPDDDESPGPNSAKRRRASSGTQGKSGSLSRKNLTEEQKRSNHIRSEQKRRNIIKQGYSDLNELVPNLKTGGFSKSAVLTETTRFLEEVKAGNDRMETYLQQLAARNGVPFD